MQKYFTPILALGFGAVFATVALPDDRKFVKISTGLESTTSLVAISGGDGSRVFALGTKSSVATFSGLGGEAWTPLPNSNPTLGLRSLTYGKGIFLASASNSVFRFPNQADVNWDVPRPAFASARIGGLGFGGASGTFIAVSQSRSIAYSIDGLSWTNGSIVAPINPGENYTAVTAFGENGFAVCGIRGLIRLSNDEGRSWTVSQPFSSNPSVPTLLAITEGGSGKLVAVGERGSIRTTSDGGTSWSERVSGTINNLNGVTYTGSEFVAVGDRGTVITSANGLDWKPVVLSGAAITDNLTSVAYANSGRLKDLVLIAGSQGTVIVGATSPSLSVAVAGTNVIYSGQSTSVRAIIGGSTGPWNFAWSNGDTQSPVTSPAVLGVTIANPDLNSVLVTNYTVTSFTDAISGFPGTATGTATISVRPRPRATVAGSQTIRSGGTANLSANLTGLGPWTVTWSDGVTQNVNATPATRTVTLTNPHGLVTTNYTFSVTALADKNYTALEANRTGSTTVTVNPEPSAMVTSVAQTIRSGGTANLSANLTGLGPWTVTWSDGVTQNVSATPATRTVTLTNESFCTPKTIVYSVVALQDSITDGASPLLAGSTEVTVHVASALKVDSGTEGLKLTWEGALELQQTSDLGAAVEWSTVKVGEAGKTNTLTITPDEARRFYRVLVVCP